MAEYLLSRIIPRADLGFRQLEQVARLDPYGQHQAVWRLFEISLATVDSGTAFLFRHEWQGDLPALYILSRRAPQDPQDRTGLWNILSKPYAPQLTVSDRLQFKLRVNPVVTRDGKRHDVVMDAKQQRCWKALRPEDRPTLSALAYEAGKTWLADHAGKHGFTVTLDRLLVDSYRTHQVRRHGRAPIRFSTLDFSGVLTVTDPAKVLLALYRGIGHARGFGCGLLLVKRA